MIRNLNGKDEATSWAILDENESARPGFVFDERESAQAAVSNPPNIVIHNTVLQPTRKIHSRFDGLYDKVRDDKEDFMDEMEFRLKIDTLVANDYIDTSVLDDIILYSAKVGIKLSDIIHLDAISKSILLVLIDNPNTFFVLQNTQKGKMRIASLEIKQWGQDISKKVVAFIIVDNDKTLADQSVDGINRVFGEQKVKIFTLSSNSNTTFDSIKIYIDAYANEPDYAMPLIALLANTKQCEKMLKLIHHIDKKVSSRGSMLRYGMIWDEADKTYTSLRDKEVKVDGIYVSCRTFIIEKNNALYRLGFVTATEGDLLDEDYPECANAYHYPVDISQEDLQYYRALHHPESITHNIPFTSKHTNNSYATQILEDNKQHFMTPIMLPSNVLYYRKIIVNSNAKTEDMTQFAKYCNRIGLYAMVFNGIGGTSIKLYDTDGSVITFKTKGKKFNERLFYIYKKYNLHDKPLIIIGRRKVDRGLGFHYCPRTNDKIILEGELGDLITENREGLVWTDEILGRIEDKATAVQKSGRLAGIIGNSPQYPGHTHYWTDEYTENLIRRHNMVVDATQSYSGCSIGDAFRQAEQDVPIIQLRAVPNNGRREHHIQKCKTQQDAKEYFRNVFKPKLKLKSGKESTDRGPNLRKPNDNGFYEATIKKLTKVWSFKEMEDKVYVGASNNDYWFYPCYRDINDKNTLEWWFIHEKFDV